MATPAITNTPLALTASEAVALTLLRDGYRERGIRTRTGLTPGDLYRLAAVHDITASHGTVEGHGCHEARGEDPCWECETAHGRAQARALAQQRRTAPTLTHPRRPGLACLGGRSAR